MATNNLNHDATASAHEALLINSEAPAVVFNPAADAAALVSFAHGQLAIMEGFLKHNSQAHGNDLISDPLLALVLPAMSALQNAAAKMNNPA